MKRRAFDLITSVVALGIALVLLLAGAGLTIASVFVKDQVKQQLVEQNITMPGDPSMSATQNFPANEYTTADANALQKYAGKPMTNGSQARAFADHYLGAHLRMIGGGTVANGVVTRPGQTFSQLAQNDPRKDTLFQGETLRGLLLNAYAFGTMGTLAGIGAIFAYIFGGIILILALLGFWHRSKTSADEEFGVGRGKRGAGGAAASGAGSAAGKAESEVKSAEGKAQSEVKSAEGKAASEARSAEGRAESEAGTAEQAAAGAGQSQSGSAPSDN